MFSDDDFKQLTYPVDRKPVDKIPRLQSLAALKSLKEQEIQYLVYAYDKNSPYQEIADLQTRKEFCASKAGYNVDKDDLTELFTLASDRIREALIAILRDSHSMEFSSMILMEQLFYEYLLRLAEPLTSDDQNVILKGLEIKGKINSQIATIIEQHKNYRAAVFGVNPEEEVITMANTFTPEYVSRNTSK